METSRYINITAKTKVINPTHDAPLFQYAGPIENYHFAHQQKNYENIQNILEPYNKKLTQIYVGSFMGERRKKTVFLAHNEDKSIWWRKYEGKAEGSGQNWIYKDDVRIKTMDFMDNPENYLGVLG